MKVKMPQVVKVDVEVPESITVNGETVKGEFVTEYCDDDKYTYWQYQGKDWLVYCDINIQDNNTVYTRATCDNEKYWALEGYVNVKVLSEKFKEAVMEMNEYYKVKEIMEGEE